MSRALLVCALLLALCAAPARAGFIPGAPVDTDVAGTPDVALARDGSGAMAYAKSAEGVYLSTLTLGAPDTPQRLDGGQPGPSSAVRVAASNGGRVLVTWINGGTLYASLRPLANLPFSPPVPVLSDATDAVLSMTINGKAYAGALTSGGDLRAAYMAVDGTWSVPDAPLDVDPARAASSPAVAASGDGTALFAWVETADGVPHVFARRVVRTTLSTVPREVSVGSFEGHAGGAADSPRVGIEYDSSYAWVAFRQDFLGGSGAVSRVLARRLLGSEFDPPQAVDGLDFGAAGDGADEPGLAFTGRGRGTFTARVRPSAVSVVPIKNDVLGTPVGFLSGSAVDAPSPTAVDDSTGTVAWLAGDGVFGRHFDAKGIEAEEVLSPPALGPSSGAIESAADRIGDAAITYALGGHAVLALYDHAPRAPSAHNDERWHADNRPKLHWSTVTDTWSTRVRYQLEIDHVIQTRLRGTTWRPSSPLPDGDHRWRIVTTDERGQQTVGIDRVLRIDTERPFVQLIVPLRARARRPVSMLVSAADVTSGIRRVSLDFGDGPPVSVRLDPSDNKTILRHRYARPGRYTVREIAGDEAGNERTEAARIRVR